MRLYPEREAGNCCAYVLWRCLGYVGEMILRAVAFFVLCPENGNP